MAKGAESPLCQGKALSLNSSLTRKKRKEKRKRFQ
jgi:hypothetical protein